MATHSDDDQVVADSGEDTSADNVGPYAIGELGIDFNVEEDSMGGKDGDSISEYEEIDPETSVDDAASGKKKSKKAAADDAITASALGAYKDPFLDAAYESPETDGLARGYE